jgi:dUTP pyrophosphatase
MIEIKLHRLPHGHGLPLPQYASEEAAGLDIASAEELVLEPGARHAVATGFAIEIPCGHEVQVRPRSGLAERHGISMPNAPGTIDADYRGEVKVPLVNLGREPFTITRGMRVAQMILKPVPRVEWEVVDELPPTTRGGDSRRIFARRAARLSPANAGVPERHS